MIERAGVPATAASCRPSIFPLLIGGMLYAHRRRSVVSAIIVGLTLALVVLRRIRTTG